MEHDPYAHEKRMTNQADSGGGRRDNRGPRGDRGGDRGGRGRN